MHAHMSEDRSTTIMHAHASSMLLAPLTHALPPTRFPGDFHPHFPIPMFRAGCMPVGDYLNAPYLQFGKPMRVLDDDCMRRDDGEARTPERKAISVQMSCSIP